MVQLTFFFLRAVGKFRFGPLFKNKFLNLFSSIISRSYIVYFLFLIFFRQ